RFSRDWSSDVCSSDLHGVGTGGRHDVGQLLSLTRADVRGGVGPVTALDQTVEDDGARGLGEELELAQRVLRLLERAARPYPDERSEERRVGKEWRCRG